MQRFKRNLKKAFTITELVIVIAVIAILAAVLIPTFTYVVKRANESAAMQAAKSASTNYYAYVLSEDSGADINGYYFVSGDYAFAFEDNSFQADAIDLTEETDTLTGYVQLTVPTDLSSDFNVGTKKEVKIYAEAVIMIDGEEIALNNATYELALETDGTATISSNANVSLTTTDNAITISGTTITAVSAGTATVTVTSGSTTIATITVTISQASA